METIITGRDWLSKEAVQVSVKDGVITTIDPLADYDEHHSGTLPYLAPGLVDMQINGCRGIDLNAPPLDPEHVAQMTRWLWSQGVTHFLPTIVTNSDEAISELMSAITAARHADLQVANTIAGIHLEGPFISPEDGPRGAHPRQHVCAPDWDKFARWQEAAEGRIVMVTLSPEWETAEAFIQRCTQSGVKVSIGHTNANSEQISRAVDAGATLSTHFGNGAHAVMPRHPNYLWDQLAEDRLWCCAIADGFHLPRSVLRVLQQVKQERLMLVSDAVSLCGMPSGSYSLHIGGDVVLSEQGRLYMRDNPALLAGSAKTLADGINQMMAFGLCSWEEAWTMASLRPAAYLDLDVRAGIVSGAPADLVAVKYEDQRVHVERTWKQGQCVWESEHVNKGEGGR